MKTDLKILHLNIFPCNHTTVTYICQSCMSRCERVHCMKSPFLLQRKETEKKIVRKKWGKVKPRSERKKQNTNPRAPCSQFPLRLGPSRAPSATTIQCFPPFNRLHQHTRVYSLQLQTVAVSNKSVFNCSCCKRPWFSQAHGRTQKNQSDNTGHCKELLKDALPSCIHYISIGNARL